VNGLIAVTDHEWFEFLSRQQGLDEVNFWRPSDTRTPRQMQPGMPVLFKLRKHYGGWIVGFGLFARHSVLPAWLAWDAFGLKNGAVSFADMRRRIERLRHGHKPPPGRGGADYSIGCLMLSQPAFLEREHWVRSPRDWPENAVQGKAYDLASGEGARVWSECLLGARTSAAEEAAAHGTLAEGAPRYGDAVLVRPRLGQGIFRIAVTEAYGAACAVTREHSLPALEAGHIRPYSDGGEHAVPNGLLMRSDIHRLFDAGYVGITQDHRFVVSGRLKDDYHNGHTYYPLDGQAIQVPPAVADRPDPRELEWHMDVRFRQ
jgi:putative restriction endonuclease